MDTWMHFLQLVRLQGNTCTNVIWCNANACSCNVLVIWHHLSVSMTSEDGTDWAEDSLGSLGITSLYRDPGEGGNASKEWAHVTLQSKSLESIVSLTQNCSLGSRLLHMVTRESYFKILKRSN